MTWQLVASIYLSIGIVFVINNREVFKEEFLRDEIPEWDETPNSVKAISKTITLFMLLLFWWWFILGGDDE